MARRYEGALQAPLLGGGGGGGGLVAKMLLKYKKIMYSVTLFGVRYQRTVALKV